MLYVKGIVEDASPPNSLSLAPEELTTYQNQLNFFSYFHPVNRYHYQELLKQAKVVILGLGDIANHLLLSLVSCGVGKIKAVDLGLAAGEDSAAGTIIDAKVNILKAKITDLNPLISFELVITSVKSSQDIRNLIKGYDLAVLPLDRPSIAIFDWINEACLYEKITWISGVLDAEEGVVGPCVVPFLTPCYKCYELRMKANLTSYQEYIIFEAYLREHSADNLHYGGFQPSAGIVGNLLAMEVIKILNKFEAPITYSNVFTINFLTLETKTHEILKLPRCPACGPTKKVPRQRAWDVEG
jgi:thiazole/oxazole-forming peptide maturase SagC family component